MKERILFVCVGQAGGNIGQLLAKKGYITYYINTSYDDLSTIKADSTFKYHVPGASGCNHDRQKAISYTKQFYQNIIDSIETKFPVQDIIFFVFSLGGGTGSGISPVLLDLLSQKNPHKTYGAIVVMPSSDESLKIQVNALECYKQLMSVEGLKNLYVLDNHKSTNIFEINQRFVELFDDFMNITNPDKRGIIDNAEINTILNTRGNVFIGKIKELSSLQLDFHKENEETPIVSFSWILDNYIDNSIFTQFQPGCRYLAISTANDIDIKIIEKRFGKPLDIFRGYNDTHNLIIAAGMPFPKFALKKLADTVKKEQKNIYVEEDNFNIDIPKLKFDFNKPKKEENKNVDFDSIFKKYM
ncbi:MAG: hypothetical protein H0Z24_06920 [Thermosipho sp. (in: Bacteria)]|nr:hypothetical protein [Thermosipho sp. (in: thermotogales)]